MIKVHILQVNSKYATEVARLKRDVTAGFTKDNWKTLKDAKAGDIAVWYVAGGPQVYAAWGWVSGVSHRVKPGEPFGPYQGPVAGMQWLPEEIDARMVRDFIGWTAATRVHGPCRIKRLLHSSSWLASYRSSHRAPSIPGCEFGA
jgi:hypothetical protein